MSSFVGISKMDKSILLANIVEKSYYFGNIKFILQAIQEGNYTAFFFWAGGMEGEVANIFGLAILLFDSIIFYK